MKRTAVFPGSFDPITNGHIDLVERGLPLFDEIIVAIGVNPKKQYMFSLEQRLSWIDDYFTNEPKVRTTSYTGLTIDFCVQENAQFMLRGLRNGTDFDYECAIAQMNKAVNSNIETIFLMTSPPLMAINSSILRELIRNGEDVSAYVPHTVKQH